MGKKLFVTVGTTQFDKLGETLCEKRTLNLIKRLGFTEIVFQVGNGVFEPPKITSQHSFEGLKIECYRFKETLREDILNSDLVISHAGAGTCLEVLRAEKLLMVVVNEQLMDNHQLELAEHFHEEGYLYYCTCSTLFDTINKLNKKALRPYPKGNACIFVAELNKLMGFAV